MNTIKVFLLFFLSIVLHSCASTKITAFKDPDYENKKFSKILIVTNTRDLITRERLETLMAKIFSEKGANAIESYKLFPPTRELSEQEKVEILIKNNVDAYLSIFLGESGFSEIYIPPTSSATKTEGEVNVYGNKATYKEKSTTNYQGGYTVKKPWAEFETRLYDVSNGQIAWIASTFTGGNAYATDYTIMYSYCEEIVEKIISDRLIKLKLKELRNVR